MAKTKPLTKGITNKVCQKVELDVMGVVRDIPQLTIGKTRPITAKATIKDKSCRTTFNPIKIATSKQKQELIQEIEATILQLRKLKRVAKKNLDGTTQYSEMNRSIEGTVKRPIAILEQILAWWEHETQE
jgi:hypothetical protein